MNWLPLPRRWPWIRLAVVQAILALSLLMALSPSLWAAPTTADDAQQVVDGWLSLEAAPLGVKIGKQVKEVKSFSTAEGANLYYVVYLNPTGFVIVPGDDLVEPIIGFLPEGTFDPAPDNPLGALVSQDVPGRVMAVRDQEAKSVGLEAMPENLQQAQSKWNRLKTPRTLLTPQESLGLTSISDVRVAALIQTKWSQSTAAGSYCYNYFTPNHYVCGCVATALSQLLRFWQYPTIGVGNAALPIYINGAATTRNLRGGDGSGGAYVWTSMPLIPANGLTDAQRQAIGNLTHDAGVSVKMNYTSSESGTDTLLTGDALRNTFKYSNAKKGYNSGSNLPATQRDTMVNPNLDAGFPVLFGISTGSAGHAIDCDGYGYNGGTEYHHLNMGWAGQDDVWYNLPTISTTNYNFTSVYKCIYNIYPTGSGEIISGRVLNQSSAAVAGATVTATKSGGGTYTAVTNSLGIYALAKVPSGSTYTITAAKTGYTFDTHSVTTGTSTDNSTTTGNLWGVNILGNSGPPGNISLNTALDNSALTFTNGGNAGWFGQSTTSSYGGSAAQSGAISDNQSSTLQTTVTVPGTLTFYWKVSSEAGYDFLAVYLDGALQDRISGEVGWQQKTYTFNTPGTHTIAWQYIKDYSDKAGSDCGWVDKVTYTPSNSGISLNAALDNNALAFTNGGSANWFGQSATSYYGGSAAQSGAISDLQTSSFQTTVTGPGTLSFYWKVSSEQGYDGLIFYLDNGGLEGISGDVDWQQRTYNIPDGTHTIKWQYIKDINVSAGSDCGWVDRITYTPSAAGISLNTALDNHVVTVTQGGDIRWFGQSVTSFYGGSAAQSGAITDSQSTSFQTQVTGPGPLSFYWAVSSEPDYDFLQVFIDNVLKDQISGNSGWQHKTYYLSRGTHTIKWVYTKDYSVGLNADCAWVDKLVCPSQNPGWRTNPGLWLLLNN
jgi:hypothetical protein